VAGWAGHAHNAYLQTLLDVGVLGAAFLFSTFILVLVSGFPGRHRRAVGWEDYAILGAMVFLLLNSITDESFAVAGNQLVVAFACVSVAARQRRVDLAAAVPSRIASLAAQPAASQIPVGAAAIRTHRL
jgi:O-antigen ligase